LCCAILLPLIALAGGKSDLMRPVTVVNDGEYAVKTAPVWAAPPVVPGGSTRGADFVGRIDTVGGTTYDEQVNGPCDQYICCDSVHGVHVMWTYSIQTSGFTDRNLRYNFYDFNAETWDFIDPTNFMNAGVNAFSQLCGFGNLDVDPVTGEEYISCARSDGPSVARDEEPGAGILDECPGAPTVTGMSPSMNLTHSEKVHVALSGDSIEYSRIDPWCSWSTPVALASGTIPTYIVRGSKTSDKVVVTWEQESPSGPGTAWYRQSTDDGISWATAVQLPFPPAFTQGSDSIPTFYTAGIYPLLDDDDNLHIVANVGWTVSGMAEACVTPTEIWHWYQPTGVWSEVVRQGPDLASYTRIGAGVGYNSLFAGRPTLCQCGPNDFVCVWEAFDSLNVEPRTGLLRADIYGARSVDAGATWGDCCRLTDPNSASKRFPSVAPRTVSDTCFIRYECDLVSGFGIDGQGPVTNNPIVVQRVWKGAIPPQHGVADSNPGKPTCAVSPSPFRGSATISYDLPKSGNVRLSVCDVLGRTVRVLVNETKGPGRYSAGWNGRNEQGRTLPAGIYFCALETEGRRLSRKLVLLP
jgi:hypothetical protein